MIKNFYNCVWNFNIYAYIMSKGKNNSKRNYNGGQICSFVNVDPL